jgi:hypothetical protein
VQQSITVSLESYEILFWTYFRCSCSGGKYKRIYIGLSFRKVGYTKYDASLSVELMTLPSLGLCWFLAELINRKYPTPLNFVLEPSLQRSRDSVVGIATGYGPDDRGFGVRVPVGLRIFSSPRRPDRLWGPPKLLPSEYRRLFHPGVKRPGREADHSPTTTPVRLHGIVLK